MNKNELTVADLELGFEKTCACGCGQRFYTRNRKRKFKNNYHKHYHHYSLKLLTMKNQNEIEKGNYKNYLVIRDYYAQGFRELSAAALMLRGYNPAFTGVAGKHEGQPALFYNDFALLGNDPFIKIIKISTWRSSNN